MPPTSQIDPADPRLTIRPHLIFWFCFAAVVMGGFILALFATGCASTGDRPGAPAFDRLREHVQQRVISIKGKLRTIKFACAPSRLDPATTRYISLRRGLGAGDAQLVSRAWPYGPRLDQGAEGACTGYGSVGGGPNSQPDQTSPFLTGDYARKVIYWGAQKRDPWPGGAYPWAWPRYEGSTVAAAIEELTEQGWCDGAEWTSDLEGLVVGVATRGPAIMGTSWYEGMVTPDAAGYLHATGSSVGGHCYYIPVVEVTSTAPLAGRALIVNSWGTDWGNDGTAWISFADLDNLLKYGGQAAFLTGKKAQPATDRTDTTAKHTPVPASAPSAPVGYSGELAWSHQLAWQLSGTAEYRIPGGRVDVLTSSSAIECDRVSKRYEAIGQALSYSAATGKRPTIALIDAAAGDERITALAALCRRHGIALWLLTWPDRTAKIAIQEVVQ